MTKAKLKKKFPATITLGFPTQERKMAFLGQFLDGWGEGAGIQADWAEYEEIDDTEFLAIEYFDDGRD